MSSERDKLSQSVQHVSNYVTQLNRTIRFIVDFSSLRGGVGTATRSL